MDKRRRRLAIWALIGSQVIWIIGLWLTATSKNQLNEAFQVQQSPLEMRLNAIHLRKADFPSTDWKVYDPVNEAMPNALIARSYAYSHNDAFWIKVSQQLSLYADATNAQTAYTQAVQEWLTPDWQPLPNLIFVGHADKMCIGCSEGYVNNIHHYRCTAVSLYGNTVTIFWANVFDDQWFTMTDFEQLLITLDQRMVAAMETAEP